MPSEIELFQEVIELEITPETVELELQQQVIELDIQPLILGVIKDDTTNFPISITNADLTGSIAVIEHGLGTQSLDVTITDSEGVINLNWIPLSDDFIRVEFEHLAPITDTYKILIEK